MPRHTADIAKSYITSQNVRYMKEHCPLKKLVPGHPYKYARIPPQRQQLFYQSRLIIRSQQKRYPCNNSNMWVNPWNAL